MRLTKRATATAFFAIPGVIISATLAAAPAGDPNNGRILAQQWCASCHLVAPVQGQATESVPTFMTIAQRPDFNAAQLALFLLNPHPIMPNMGLTRMEAADLAAYIAQLKK